MQIRDAALGDLPAIVDIYNEDLLTTTSIWTETPQTLEDRLAWFAARTARRFPTLVAEEAGRVRGIGTFADFRDSISRPGYRYTVEHSVYIYKACWSRGIGQALMHALFERASERNVHSMIGGIDGSNTRSLEFHERLGFREVARMPETGYKQHRWCDLVFVQRFIDGAGAPRDS
jgi:L-amino acid N-acyltransferase YncA